MGRLEKMKRLIIEEVNKRILGEDNISDDKEIQKRKLQQRLWDTIESVDNERETKSGVKLSNKDVAEILLSIVDSLSPIDFSFKDLSDRDWSWDIEEDEWNSYYDDDMDDEPL
jgi:hypothetical protein